MRIPGSLLVMLVAASALWGCAGRPRPLVPPEFESGQVSQNLPRTSRVRWSPDGRSLVAVQSWGAVGHRRYRLVLAPDSGRPPAIIEEGGGPGPTAAITGDTIAPYLAVGVPEWPDARPDRGPDPIEAQRLWAVDGKGRLRKLLGGAPVGGLLQCPGGKPVVILQKRSGPGMLHIEQSVLFWPSSAARFAPATPWFTEMLDVAMKPQCRQVAIFTYDRCQIYQAGKLVRTLPVKEAPVRGSVTWSPMGRLLLSWHAPDRAFHYGWLDLKDGQLHESRLSSIIRLTLPDGMVNVAWSINGDAVFWGQTAQAFYVPFEGGQPEVIPLSGRCGDARWSPDGRRVALCVGGQVAIWEARTRGLKVVLQIPR